MTNTHQSNSRQWLSIFSIIFAGEMIFSLPFHLARFFRPTFLNAFELTNTQLGDIFAFYGVIAMLAYFPGGYLADRFSARKLMASALVATSVGGIYLSTYPSAESLKWLFAYWGLTTILFFWSAMIKLTRDVANRNDQGKAFGVLDGGRGLVAALMASLAVLILSLSFPDSIDTLSGEERLAAFRIIIYYYSVLTFLAAMIIWQFIPEPRSNQFQDVESNTVGFSFMPLMNKLVWYQAAVVFSAYCGFKGLDYFGLYLVNVYNYSEIASSELVAHSSFIRPVSAISAGFLADKFLPSRVLLCCFLLVLFSYMAFLFFDATTGTLLITGNILFCFIIVFALRAVYFALIEQTQIARNLTGVSVGIISVIGFTPDIFFAPLAGRLLDNPDSLLGFEHFFSLLLIIALIGAAATYLLTRTVTTNNSQS